MLLTSPPTAAPFHDWAHNTFQAMATEINSLKTDTHRIAIELSETRAQFSLFQEFVEQQHPEVLHEFRTVQAVRKRLDEAANRAVPESYAETRASS